MQTVRELVEPVGQLSTSFQLPKLVLSTVSGIRPVLAGSLQLISRCSQIFCFLLLIDGVLSHYLLWKQANFGARNALGHHSEHQTGESAFAPHRSTANFPYLPPKAANTLVDVRPD